MNEVASPCINVCEMDKSTGLCRGCFRNLDEIAGWGGADTARKIEILARVEKRRADHERRSGAQQ